MSGSIRPLIAILWALFIGIGVASAETPWSRLRDRNFEIYATESGSRAREVLKELERARWLLAQAGISRTDSEFPVRVILFQTQREYSRYAVTSYAAAYYMSRLNRDTIVMTADSSREVITHEYMHYLMHDTNVPLPPWFSEGIADFYSTVRSEDGHIELGLPVDDRVRAAEAYDRISLPSLLAARRADLAELSPAQQQAFFAGSWELVRMLRLAPAYSPRFGALRDGLRENRDASDLFHELYGKTLEQVESDLVAYGLEKTPARERCLAGQETTLRFEAEEAVVPAWESRMVLADLLGKLKRYRQAESLLGSLRRERPQDWVVEESLAYLYLDERNFPEAGWHFSQAVAKGSANPRLFLHYGQLLRAMSGPPEQQEYYLRRALALKPDFTAARLELSKTTTARAVTEFAETRSLPAW